MNPPMSMDEIANIRRPLSAPEPPARREAAAIVPSMVVSTTVELKPGIFNRLVVVLWMPMAVAIRATIA